MHLRTQIAAAGWVRAFLLDEEKAARELSIELEKHLPVTAPYLKRYLAASDTHARKFAGAWLLLRLPGLKPYVYSGIPIRKKIEGIDSLRENWWCAFSIEEKLDGPGLFKLYKSQNPASATTGTMPKDAAGTELPGFLSESEKEASRQEWSRLMSLDTAPNLLSEIVVSWARKHPDDPRIPEALHLAVNSTRYGCTNPDTGKYSQAAFQLLHRDYPASSWAKMTKYWYR